MKYQTASFADGMFTIHCPHCKNEVQVDEGQLEHINGQIGQMAGRYNCPIPACAKEIEFPTAEEAAALKAGGAVPAAPATSAAPAPTPAAPAAPTPVPPAQANPAAKPTQPPAGAPAPVVASPPAATGSQPQTSPADKATQLPASAPKPPGYQKPSAFEYAAERRDAIVDLGFHGSKGATLEREAATVQRMIVKTILHGDCVKDGKDDFDETVSKFLSELVEESLLSVHPVQVANEKKGADFGVLIIYKMSTEED